MWAAAAENSKNAWLNWKSKIGYGLVRNRGYRFWLNVLDHAGAVVARAQAQPESAKLRRRGHIIGKL